MGGCMSIEIRGETYYSFQEACDFLGVTRGTIDNYVKQGRLQKYHRNALSTRVYFKLVELQRLADIKEDLQESED
jgi:predicted site-specific integrase-resolvase